MTITALDSWIVRRTGGISGPLRSDDLAAWQTLRLRETLARAVAGSSFYRKRMAVPDPLAIDSPADIARFPFTTADDLSADPMAFLCVGQDDIERVVTLNTSGTTGTPKRLFFTADDHALTVDFFYHGLLPMTAPGDRVLILLPGGRPGGVADLLCQAVRRRNCTPLVAGVPANISDMAAFAARSNANLIVGFPVPMLAMARSWKEQGLATASIRTVLLCSDHIAPSLPGAIADLLSVEVFSDWGMTELAYGGGVDCSCHCGYHLQEADFLFEIIDPDTGAPQPPGCSGEIVVTSLTRRGMPLIRYRTGDISHLMPGRCPCGSVLKRLGRIAGRRTGLIRLDDGVIALPDLDEALVPLPDLVDFTARFTRENGNGTLCIRPLVAGALSPGLSRRVRAALEASPGLRPLLDSGRLTLRVEATRRFGEFAGEKRMIAREEAS